VILPEVKIREADYPECSIFLDFGFTLSFSLNLSVITNQRNERRPDCVCQIAFAALEVNNRSPTKGTREPYESFISKWNIAKFEGAQGPALTYRLRENISFTQSNGKRSKLQNLQSL
jgi:hypothetical protein